MKFSISVVVQFDREYEEHDVGGEELYLSDDEIEYVFSNTKKHSGKYCVSLLHHAIHVYSYNVVVFWLRISAHLVW